MLLHIKLSGLSDETLGSIIPRAISRNSTVPVKKVILVDPKSSWHNSVFVWVLAFVLVVTTCLFSFVHPRWQMLYQSMPCQQYSHHDYGDSYALLIWDGDLSRGYHCAVFTIKIRKKFNLQAFDEKRISPQTLSTFRLIEILRSTSFDNKIWHKWKQRPNWDASWLYSWYHTYGIFYVKNINIVYTLYYRYKFYSKYKFYLSIIFIVNGSIENDEGIWLNVVHLRVFII